MKRKPVYNSPLFSLFAGVVMGLTAHTANISGNLFWLFPALCILILTVFVANAEYKLRYFETKLMEWYEQNVINMKKEFEEIMNLIKEFEEMKKH